MLYRYATGASPSSSRTASTCRSSGSAPGRDGTGTALCVYTQMSHHASERTAGNEAWQHCTFLNVILQSKHHVTNLTPGRESNLIPRLFTGEPPYQPRAVATDGYVSHHNAAKAAAERVLDYSAFSIRVEERDIERLDELLAGVDDATVRRLQDGVASVWWGCTS